MPEDPKRIVRAYHERTKHHFQHYAAGPHGLDWANQPDPFRRFLGAELLPLEIDPPINEGTKGNGGDEPRYGPALIEGGVAPEPVDRATISRLFFDSLALSAWKQIETARWSLRVNPSSGNLHPTEGYLVAGPIAGLSDEPGLYHYAPREHGLELRARLPAQLWERLELPPGAFLVGLTTIHWRESWKYGERAYRYCNHDAGHAMATAAGLGWRARLDDDPSSDALGALLGVFDMEGPEAVEPECLIAIDPRPERPDGNDVATPVLVPETVAQLRALERFGRPNVLSPEHVTWDVIDAAVEAARKRESGTPYTGGSVPGAARPLEPGKIALRRIVRQRRSAVQMDGRTGMPAADFFRALEATMARAGRLPFTAIPWSPRVHLALFVHRVEGLEPGLYWLARDPDRLDAARAACREEFLWERPADAPDELPLFLLFPSNLQGPAAQVSCQQDIAGRGAFSLGMLADFERSIDELGAWFYPRLFWETGAVGQILYLEAEALGLRSTGIGCFFDDPVHALLGIRGHAWQSLYHFTVGGPVDDPRLTTHPAYPSIAMSGDPAGDSTWTAP
ncbi:MAG: SagB/ThcOx family dehydrogenase [Planctomycetota bacterium]|nr:SagB/ThcOx family dehydrogenase [Planctomycetota bacterium]